MLKDFAAIVKQKQLSQRSQEGKMTALRQLNRVRTFRNKETGEKSNRFLRVLPRRLTVKPGYVQRDLDPGTYATLFREVEIVPMLETLDCEGLALLKMPAGTVSETREEFLARLMAAFEKFIEDNWSPTKFHVVAHSSGFDSRFISAMIKRIYKRRGSIWLGDVIFVCTGNECAGFEQVMKFEGWDETRYALFSDWQDFYKFTLDFDQVWKWANGAMMFTRSPNVYMIEKLQELGRAPADENEIQVWCGYDSNTLFTWSNAPQAGNRVEWRYDLNYRYHESLDFYKAGEEVNPFQSYDVLAVTISSQVRFGSNLRAALYEFFDPALAAIPRSDSKWRTMTSEQVQQKREEYLASWYGRNVYPEAVNVITPATWGYADWWSYWTSAALIEYLLASGYEISEE